ncbi:hypothetical protein C7C46_15710 [Streptomyces tateyamensis]|uniref:Uncharacterized protein n=1 Tax=Streptomyces tateyamensis TaxID=565073 RepID=A0A2V4N3F2_9ACTN|nr:hypothetical protein [Streptomyces tateyamensis]PYC78555.1 hypothetical protein C7C46_15710 [Streptomyces tateyamensis]
MTEAQITGMLMGALALTALAGLAVIVVPDIWGAAPTTCDPGSTRLTCSAFGGILLWDVPLLGVPATWAVGLAGIFLHRGRRPVWTLASLLGLTLLYLTDYWIAVA